MRCIILIFAATYVVCMESCGTRPPYQKTCHCMSLYLFFRTNWSTHARGWWL